MSLTSLETIGGPNGEAEIFEYEPEGVDRLLGGIGPNRYMLRFNGNLVGHYDDLHDARSEANSLTGNNG